VKLEFMILMENIINLSDKYFMEELDNFIEFIDKNLSEKELQAFTNLLDDNHKEEIDELLLESTGYISRIAPPAWIAMGGQVAVSKFDELAQAYSTADNKLDYHKAISAWKDWESFYHKKPRLKGNQRIKIIDQVKERFKGDLEKENTMIYILLIHKSKPLMKIYDDRGESLGYQHSNVKYLIQIAPDYQEISGKNLLINFAKQSLKEKKAKKLSTSTKNKLVLNSDDYLGITISEKHLKEFSGRSYHAYKHYKKKIRKNVSR